MKLLKVLFIITLIMKAANVEATDVTFSKETFTFGNTSIPYRKADIGGNGNKAALVIYLHGGTSKGNDNEAQLNEPGINSITSWLVDHKRKAIMIVPQSPKDKSWLGIMLPVIKNLMQTFIERGVADEQQVYIFGGSMGGTGTWNMLSSYPGFFAAAMPVAGNPSGLKAEAVKQTPLYTVMGTADVIMKIPIVETFLAEMDSYEAEYQFDIEEGWTHEDVCKQSYTDKRLTWVFSHTKGDIINSINDPCTIVHTNNLATTIEWYTLSGQRLPFKPLQRGVYIKNLLMNDGREVSEKIYIP